MNGETSMASCTREAVLKTMGCVMKGDWMGRGSNRLGWLQTLRSCIRMLITDMKWPLARVSRVLGEESKVASQRTELTRPTST